MFTEIGSFTIGGVPWTIKINNGIDSNWLTHLNCQEVFVKTEDNYSKFNYDSIEKNIYHAIINTLVTEYMYYSKYTVQELKPFSLLFKQAIDTLTCSENELDGSFILGNVEYSVIVDNTTARLDNFFGMCYYNNKMIKIASIDAKGEPMKIDFIFQTIFHEILHAINGELGITDKSINSEKCVNVLAIFLYEVYKTLKINFPDESD